MAKDLPGTHYHPVAGWLRPSEGERISSNTKPLSPNRWMFGSTKHRQESLRMAGTPWMFYLSPWEKLSNMSMVLTGPHLGKTLLFNVANPHLIHTETKTTSVVLAQKLRGESAFVHPESRPPAFAPSFRDRDPPVRPVKPWFHGTHGVVPKNWNPKTPWFSELFPRKIMWVKQ